MKSIRRTLAAWLLPGLGLVLLIGGTGLYIAMRHALMNQFDQTLEGRLATLMSAARWDDGRVEIEVIGETMPWYAPGPHAEYFEIRHPEGVEFVPPELRRSPSLKGGSLPVTDASKPGARVVVLPDGRSGRAIVKRFRPASEDPSEESQEDDASDAPELTLIVAKGCDELELTLRTLLFTLVGVGAGVGIALGGLVAIALRRGLEPLGRLSDEVASIDHASLSRRLDDSSLAAELHPVYARLNDLFARLETAFDRERRFTAAAAHELRTPLAELRSLLEVSLSRVRSLDESRTALQDSLGVTLQMERLVSGLFTMARHQTGKTPLHVKQFGVSALVRGVCEKHRAAAVEAGGEIRVAATGACDIRSDDALVDSIVQNMVSNAVQHAVAPPMVSVRVELVEGGRVRVDVTNRAMGIGTAEIERFFEPFWRRSESRTDREHLGLGLSVAHLLAQHLGGSLTAVVEAPDSVRVRLELPVVATES